MPIERIRSRLQDAIDKRYKRTLPGFDGVVEEEGKKEEENENKTKKVSIDPAYKSAGSGLSIERARAVLIQAIDEILEEDEGEGEHVEKAVDEYLDANVDGTITSFLREESKRACREYLEGERKEEKEEEIFW